MQILFATKSEENTYSTEEIVKLFEGSDNLEDIKSAVEKAEERIYASWASVEMSDHAGELIPIDDLIQQQDTLLKRNGPISDEHTNRIIGQTLAYKVMEHPKTKSKGVLHLNKIFADTEFDEKIWKEIVDGTRTGSSVGGFNTSTSEGVDKVTGEKTTILEGFHQFETASVDEPCNPEALNEAYSVVAKSNMSETKKPSQMDRCVAELIKDPNFKPEDPNMTKEQAAFAVCNEAMKSGKDCELCKIYGNNDTKGENNKNKLNFTKSITDILNIKKGDIMPQDVKKDISEIKDAIKALADEVSQIKTKQEEEKPNDEEEKKKADEEQPTPPEKPEEEEKKKAEDEDPKKPEEEKKKAEDEEKPDDEVEKENAASDIEGEGDAASPKAPDAEAPNDEDVFKRISQKVDKKFADIQAQMVSKGLTPRPLSGEEVKKQDTFNGLAMDLATGKKKMPWGLVNKTVNDQFESKEGI